MEVGTDGRVGVGDMCVYLWILSLSLSDGDPLTFLPFRFRTRKGECSKGPNCKKFRVSVTTIQDLCGLDFCN